MSVSRRALWLALWILPGSAAGQAITKLPMLQSFHGTELRVQWESDANPAGSQNRLEWGAASPVENLVSATTTELAPDRFLHRAVATRLEPQIAYVYRVRSGSALSPTYSIRTAPLPETPFRMAWIADNQNQLGTPFLSVLTKLAARAPDVIGHAGDTVQNGDLPAEWQSQWFDPFAAAPGSLGQRTPVLVARGNHDGEFPESFAYHWLPGNGMWYAETIGRTRLIFLDSNWNVTQQDDFLRAELASAASRDADFRIVVFHKPPYTNLWDYFGYRGEAWVRDVWTPIFEQGNVDLVVNGHAHAYERGFLNGIAYTIVGGAGGALDTVPQSPPWAFIQVALSVHHYAIMDVDGTALHWTVYDLQDHVIDSFELRSAATGIPVFPTARAR